MRKAADVLLIGSIACVVVAMSLFLAGPAWMNADTPLLTVMSLQRITLFIWGQNRFLNVVPAAASLIRDPTLNLAVQLLLFGGGFVALLSLLGGVVSRTVLSGTGRIDGWLCFSVILSVFLLITSGYGIYVFIPEGQPYGLSGLLVGLGLLLLLRNRPPGRIGRIGAPVMMLIGGGLNPSLVLVAGFICVLAFLHRRELRFRAVLALATATATIGIWLVVARTQPGPAGYGTFTHDHVVANLRGTLRFMNLGLVMPVLTGLTALDAAICVVLAVSRRRGGPSVGIGWKLPAASTVFTAAWVVAFSQNRWVILNGYHFRYFYPVFLTLPILLSLPMLLVLIGSRDAVKVFATVLSLLVAVCLLVAPWRPLRAFPVFARVAPAVDVARDRDIRFVSGTYWTVWPAVFLLLDDHRIAFGLERERGSANAAAAAAELHRLQVAGMRPRSLCLDEPARDCADVAGRITGEDWKPVAEDCGRRCSMIEAVDARP